MNIHFSGDTRDLFKFDLIRHLMKEIHELERFTFVPMITEEKEKTRQVKSQKKELGHAMRSGKAGSLNRELMEHLGRLQEIESDMEYFTGIRSYFKQERIIVDILHEDRFSHENRRNYFERLLEKIPKQSLIYLDPDTGLEVKNPTQRHLLYEEVKKIHDRMDPQSIMVIYQHIPRIIREGYIKKRCREISEVTGTVPSTITDNEIVFFILAKDPALHTQICAVLADYMKSYTLHYECGCR
jgi:hypothetical protein